MSMKPKILFMDDVEEHIEPLAELLAQDGYQVLKALTVDEAEQILNKYWVNLIIVDLNMQADDDGDRSGVKLVNNPAYASIPKVILTGFANDPQIFRPMLNPSTIGDPSFKGLLGKNDGDIYHTILHILDDLPLNRDLQLVWSPQSLGSLMGLTELLLPNNERADIAIYADELEDLFRQLFLASKQVSITRILVYQAGVIWFYVTTKDKAEKSRQFIVACGDTALVNRQAIAYLTRTENNTLRAVTTAATLHFSGILYECPSDHLAEIRPLRDFYLRWPSSAAEYSIETLFKSTLPPWHSVENSTCTFENLQQLYQTCWPDAAALQPTTWQAKLVDLCNKAASIGGLSRIAYASTQLTFYIGNEALTCPNPLHFLLTEITTLDGDFTTGTIHGRLLPENIVVDDQKRAWLIDFSQVREAPLILDFVTLEVALKLDMVPMADVSFWCQLEKLLLSAKSLEDTLVFEHLEPERQKMFRMISTLRKSASKIIQERVQNYFASLFAHSLAQVADYDPTQTYGGYELTRYLYALISAALICQHLAPQREFVPNFVGRTVLVDGQEKSGLTRQEWQLLEYLWERRGQLCTVEEILQEIYGDATDDIENGAWLRTSGRPKVNAAIRRLRIKTEPDWQNPRYILTEREHGYKLENE